jgi:hypothetical protein
MGYGNPFFIGAGLVRRSSIAPSCHREAGWEAVAIICHREAGWEAVAIICHREECSDEAI